MTPAKPIKSLYFLKIKGTHKIPDYVQLRDDQFTLIAYFRPERPERALRKVGLEEYIEPIRNIVETIPYGKVVKIDIETLQKDS